MARKPAIFVPTSLDEVGVLRSLQSLREWVEVVQGVRGSGKVKPLPSSATMDDVIDKINEIVSLLQG